MKYLLIESSVPAIVKEQKPKPIKSEPISKTLAGLGGGIAATTNRFGVGKQLDAFDRKATGAALPKIMSKMGKFGTSKVGSKLGKAAAWTAGRGLGSWGVGGALAFGAGSTVAKGLAGAGGKIAKKFRKPKVGVPNA